MAIEPLTRRTLLASAVGWAAAPGAGAGTPASTATLFTAWDEAAAGGEPTHHVGRLRLAGSARVLEAMPVPTRAHGLVQSADGALIVVARRPGDWLLRWQPRTRRSVWHWNDAGRVFNGHARLRGDRLFTTETDLASGQGAVVLRDARSLREIAAWPTRGRDPHDLLFDDDGGLWIANGGIGTDAATGRGKDTRAMDSSLVCLDAATGALRGRWQLADAKLSLRHLARAADGRIGIALQAEHDDAALRAQAPLLAVWQDGRLEPVAGPPAAGYGGDITALDARFVVSAPRAGRVDAWHPVEGWRTLQQGAEPCALAVVRGHLWCGTDGRWLCGDEAAPAPGRRFDNHAVAG